MRISPGSPAFLSGSTRRLALAGSTALLALGLAACAGSTTTSDTTPSAEVSAATSSAAGAASGAAASGAAASGAAASGAAAGGAASGAKVSANTASESEIEAALKSAGVSNPGRWAEEVVEYRPYEPSDPNLTKLRKELAKYNPGQETTDKIVSALTP